MKVGLVLLVGTDVIFAQPRGSRRVTENSSRSTPADDKSTSQPLHQWCHNKVRAFCCCKAPARLSPKIILPVITAFQGPSARTIPSDGAIVTKLSDHRQVFWTIFLFPSITSSPIFPCQLSPDLSNRRDPDGGLTSIPRGSLSTRTCW